MNNRCNKLYEYNPVSILRYISKSINISLMLVFKMFIDIQRAIERAKSGKLIGVVEKKSKMDSLSLVIPAETVNYDILSNMMRNGDRIYVSLLPETIGRLKIPFIPSANGLSDISFGVDIKGSKGSSPEDLLKTVKALSNPETLPEDLVVPGHVIPVRVSQAGVLEKPGIAEASLDIARMAGLSPVGLFTKIESRVTLSSLMEFLKDLDIPVISISDLVRYRLAHERLIERVVEATLPTKFYGVFRAIGYRTRYGNEYVALVKGDVRGKEKVLTRIHSECLTGDVFHSLRCDCGDQLEHALKKIEGEKRGILLYMLGHEGRGIGIINKLMAYRLQEKGKDTVDANLELGFPPDLRSYGVAAQILMDLGVKSIRLMTNNPWKIEELERYGISVVRYPLEVQPCPENVKYLRIKKEKLGHMFSTNFEFHHPGENL